MERKGSESGKATTKGCVTQLVMVARVCRKHHGFVGGGMEVSVDRLKKDSRGRC